MNYLLESTNRGLVDTTLPKGEINVQRDIRNNKVLRENKIPIMIVIKMNKSRPRCPFAIEKPNIWCNIKATTQSLDWVEKSCRERIRACCWSWVFHGQVYNNRNMESSVFLLKENEKKKKKRLDFDVIVAVGEVWSCCCCFLSLSLVCSKKV